MKLQTGLSVPLLIVATAFGAAAQERASQETVTIPKEEYQRLLAEHDELVAEMAEMKAFKARVEAAQQTADARQAETDQSLDELNRQIASVEQVGEDAYSGSTKFLLAGYGSGDFASYDRNGEDKFGAAFNPILLWKLSDRLLFEGEFELELEGDETEIALELAHISYVLDDYITIGVGRFLNPANYFVERQHMAWVNKFPDKPLAVYDGLMPETQLGIQVRGGIPLGPAKLGYAVFVSNANELNADPGSVDPTELGTLGFKNFDNVGDHFAVGGRVGLLPIPELEIGYGFQYANVAPGHGNVSSVMHSVDASYVADLEPLGGILNLKGQWVWSHVDRILYDPSGSVGGPFGFRNNRDGGYAQIAYRPSRSPNQILKNLETVFRYDSLNQKRTLTGLDESRYSFGLNYWITPSTVVKTAYEIDHQSGPEADRHDAFLLQFAAGF